MEKKTKAQIAADKATDIEQFVPQNITEMEKSVFRTGYSVGYKNGYNTTTLKWRRIDPDNLPQSKVFAINDVGGYHIGLLSNFEANDGHMTVICSSVMIDCTHYIPISLLLQLPKED